jgi:asparagine synthase (glutamine-hydrolysing)
MCGICGQFDFGSGAPVDARTLGRMTQSMVHRGPDDEGYHIDRDLGLGFRRLSIIDLGGGHQPMSDREETVWVVFNGEIYNFQELRDELEAHGHRFQTRSDTEVIVHGYKQWGDEVLNRLNGMFGLAIWDARKRRLMVARDPFGIKVVYYRIDGGRIVFGSEIRPVLAGFEDRPDVDPVALNLFLRYRYTPSPYTILKGVRKLAPGTMISVERGRCEVRRWYQSRPSPFVPAKSKWEAREELTDIYRRAVKRHLIADVPVGLLLSGGVDSGLLLSLMNENGGPWRTYTVGYGASYANDELESAADTAGRFSSIHTDVRIDRQMFEAALPRIVSCLEEPIASSSIVPMYFVAARARQDVKVALAGQGPDELFGGYTRHLGVRYGPLWSRLPESMRNAASSAIAALPRNEAMKRGVYALAVRDRLRRYQHVLSLLPGDTIDGLFRADTLPPAAGDAILESWSDLTPLMADTDELGGLQYLEMRSTLGDELLMYTDKLSMAHGLEVRVPYLDRELVEYVERLPASFKVRGTTRKWIHRKVATQLVPRTILRRKKQGFAVDVVNSWFSSVVNGRMEDLLADPDSRMYTLLRPTAVARLLDEHRSGANDNHKVLFSLALLEQWLRQAPSPAMASPTLAAAACTSYARPSHTL